MHFVPLILVAAAGGASALAQYRTGQLQDIQHRQQEQAEQDAARDREIERRRQLLAALASQSAEAGALGVASGVGSRAAITLTDVKRAQMDSLSDRAMTSRRALMLRQAGRGARQIGTLGAVSTLLQTAGQAASLAPK